MKTVEFTVSDLDYARQVIACFGGGRSLPVGSLLFDGDEYVEVVAKLPKPIERALLRHRRDVPGFVRPSGADCRVFWRTDPRWGKGRLYRVGLAGLGHIVAEIAAGVRQ